MKTLIALILCLLLIILVITLVLRSVERKPTVEARRVPVTYVYHYLKDGRPIRFLTQQRCLLSERGNLINSKTGEIEEEKVSDVREVINYDKVNL